MTDNSEQWTIPLRLNGQQTNLCIDTGAEVTVILEKVYFCIGSPALKPLDKTLKGAGNNRLDPRSQFLGCLRKGDLTIKEKIYLVENLQKSLQGRPAIMGLNLVGKTRAYVDSVIQSLPATEWQRRRHRYSWSGFNRTTFEVQPRPQIQIELNLVVVIQIAFH